MFVDPEREGKGIGKALLVRACESLRRAGYDTAWLSTAPGTRAARFYHRAGWSEAGYTQDGQVIFTRRIGPARAPPGAARAPGIASSESGNVLE